MRNLFLSAAAAVAVALPSTASAQLASPNGALPSGVSVIGGVVADLIGTNGTRLVSQLSASSLYRGFSNNPENPVPGTASGNPLTIGTQTGFTASNLLLLGGGLSSASFRFTLYDGDTGAGNFDENDNTLLVNGATIGNWSSVSTSQTNSTGGTIGSATLGFLDDQLYTGWFTTTDLTALGTIWSALNTNLSLVFQLQDVDPADNFFDFTQGINSSLINVGSGPTVQPPTGTAVPEPASLALVIGGAMAMGAAARRRRKA
ncbi:MAG: PEP-CTERM sorting domain-containing protein [Gemmatimonas sp.]|uniref:PEP-CTERM sorting domain-containing protein n=1 Tax=Gemmatimonas sp. TaxID=1962908 RepID=UPI00391D2C77